MSKSAGKQSKFPLTLQTKNSLIENESRMASTDNTAIMSTFVSNSNGIINPVFVDHDALVKEEALNKPIINKPETVDRTDSASFLSSSGGSTVISNAGSTSGLLACSNIAKGQNCVPSSCPECAQFHQNRHVISLVDGKEQRSYPAISPQLLSYAPYPPEWYYLLAADTKQFGKHRHTHYRKDCRQCRAIVRSTFEKYYLGYAGPLCIQNNNKSNQANAIMSSNRNQSAGQLNSNECFNSPMLDSDQLSKPEYFLSQLPNSFITCPLPNYRSRASCGRSCLKYTILFYCSITIIMSICFICYITQMFGLMANSKNRFSHETIFQDDSMSINVTSNWSIGMKNFTEIDNTTDLMLLPLDINPDTDTESSTLSLMETIRTEFIYILITSAFIIIFGLGLVAAFLESVLCLRIFGAILSYLFLLTFGSALYLIILLIISHVPLRLILSTISCSAVAITIHGLLAIAPIAFADLISEQKNDELKEEMPANPTYFKYPSIRYFSPLNNSDKASNIGQSYFRLKNFGWNKKALLYNNDNNNQNQPTFIGQEMFILDEPDAALNNNPEPLDNISSKGLLPSSKTTKRKEIGIANASSRLQNVQFNDNWI